MRIPDILNFKTLKNLIFTEYTIGKPANPKNEKIGGCYRLFNRNREIIYIGKSSQLQTRFNEHLSGNSNASYFIRQVKFVDYIAIPNPLDRAVLEMALIGYFKPKYNYEVKQELKHLKGS